MKKFIVLGILLITIHTFAQHKGSFENNAPVFVKEMPDTTIAAGLNYLYTYKAIDPDGDSIKYYPQTALPQNCILLPTGHLRWRPANNQLGLYKVSIFATDGSLTIVSKVAKVTVISIMDVSENETIPETYSLSQNYPNPFNPSTVISYQIPVAGHVTLKVYDVLGKVVATLVDEFKTAGSYNYQLTIINYQLTSGVYFYRLQSGSYSETKKLILMK